MFVKQEGETVVMLDDGCLSVHVTPTEALVYPLEELETLLFLYERSKTPYTSLKKHFLLDVEEVEDDPIVAFDHAVNAAYIFTLCVKDIAREVFAV